MAPHGPHLFKASPPSLLSLFLLTLGAYLVLSSPAFPALPPGSASLELQYRLTETDPRIGPTTSYPQTNYRFSLTQETVNWGSLSGFVNWSDEPYYHRRGSWLLEFRDFYFDRTKLDAAVGDSIFRPSLIGEPPFRFSNLIDPDLVVEGARARLTSDRGEVELLAGDLVALRGAFGTGVEYLGETLVGARSRFRLLPGLRLGAQILRFGHSPQDDEITYPLYRRNDLYTLSAEVEPWPGYRLLQGEVSFARYRKQDMEGERERGWDYSLILGPSLRTPRLSLEANFRHIGPDYRPYSRFYGSDLEGLFFSGEYRPFPYLSLFSSADRYRNNLKEDPDRATIETRNAIFGLRLGAPPFPLLTLRYGIGEKESRHPRPSPTDNRLQSYTAELSSGYRGWLPIIRYQRYDYDDQVTPSSDYTSDLYFLELRRTFGDGSYTWANGEWNRYRRYDPSSITDTYTLRLGADYRILPALSLRGEVSYSRSRNSLDTADTERKEAYLAVTASLPWNFSLYAEYRCSDLDDLMGPSDRVEHRLYVRASQNFSWGQRPPSRAPLVPGAPPPGYGTIVGIAFDDRNGNGLRDQGEPPLPGIRVQLEDGSVATTDQEGRFSFTGILMGEHTLSLDTKKIPLDYDLAGEPRRKVEVKRRGTSQVEFSFLLLGKASGRVIEDSNGNGEVDEGEKGMANVLVVATSQEKKLLTYTDEEGNFFFEGLRAGEYQLTLDAAYLPEGSALTSPSPLHLSLSPGGEQSGLDFLVHIPPRPVIKKIFGEPEAAPPELPEMGPALPSPPPAPESGEGGRGTLPSPGEETEPERDQKDQRMPSSPSSPSSPGGVESDLSITSGGDSE